MDEYRMIDGKDVTDFIAGFILFIKKIAGFIFISLKKNIIWGIVTFCVVLGAGYGYWSQSKPVFEAEMVCEFKDLNKKTFGEMLHALDILAKSKSYNALSNNLHIPGIISEKIMGIEGKNMAGSKLYEDITQDKAPIYISVVAIDNTVFAGLDTSIVNYLNTNSPVLVQKNDLERNTINTKINFVKHDIAMADSAVGAYNYAMLKRKKPDSELTAVQGLLKNKKDMEDNLISLEQRAVELKSTVSILHGFKPTDFAVNEKNKIIRLTIGMALFLPVFVSVLIQLFRVNHRGSIEFS